MSRTGSATCFRFHCSFNEHGFLLICLGWLHGQPTSDDVVIQGGRVEAKGKVDSEAADKEYGGGNRHTRAGVGPRLNLGGDPRGTAAGAGLAGFGRAARTGPAHG